MLILDIVIKFRIYLFYINFEILVFDLLVYCYIIMIILG